MFRGFAFVLPFSLVCLLGLAVALNDVRAANPYQDSSPNPEQVEKELSEALDAVKNYTAAESEEAYEKALEALETADRFIELQQDRLSENWAEMTDEAKKEARDALHVIRGKRSLTAEWVGRIRAGSDKTWDDVLWQFADSYGDMSDSLIESERKAFKNWTYP